MTAAILNGHNPIYQPLPCLIIHVSLDGISAINVSPNVSTTCGYTSPVNKTMDTLNKIHEMFFEELKKLKDIGYIKFINSRSCPLLRFTHCKIKVTCDLSFNKK